MRLTRSQLLKLVGVAGAVGVAATGALVVRNERERRAYTPDEVREQLHVRYAQAAAAQPLAAQNASESDEKDAVRGWRRLPERVRRLPRRNR